MHYFYCLCCRMWTMAEYIETPYVSLWACMGCGRAYGLRQEPPRFYERQSLPGGPPPARSRR